MSVKKSYKKTTIGERKLSPETQMMSYGYDPFMSEGAVKPPVFLTSTFAFKDAEDGERFFDVMSGRKADPEGKSAGLIYSRFNHPNLEIIEDRLALIEEAESCAVFASGMGAISSVFLALLKPKDVIVHSSPLYGGTETLIRKTLKNWDIDSISFTDGLNSEAMSDALEKGAKLGHVGLVFIETPANPTNAVVDFSKLKIALDKFEKHHGYRPVVACDNTMFGPAFQKPLQHGVDLCCYSLTKYVGGHSDLVAGAVMGQKSLMEKVRSTRSNFGSQLDPHSCWMISRSLETLFLRMKRGEESALQIAEWLSTNPYSKVELFHPKYAKNPAYQEAFKKQCTGFGSTFAFTINGGRKESFAFINSLQLFKSAVSLGGSESLICHPASTTHSGVVEEMRKIFGVSEGLIRVSIGLEDPQDLIADLDNAFKLNFGK
jgi:methionine-gamma-lyase